MNDVQAGRETDVLVAEKCMRWSIMGVAMSPGLKSRSEMIAQMADETGVPHYSTDIAAAWPVLEWLRDLMGPEVIVGVAYDHVLQRWTCGNLTDAADLRAPATAETAPLAICRAALQAYAKFVTMKAVRDEDELIRRSRRLKLEE